jgi:hypothetical protein
MLEFRVFVVDFSVNQNNKASIEWSTIAESV